MAIVLWGRFSIDNDDVYDIEYSHEYRKSLFVNTTGPNERN